MAEKDNVEILLQYALDMITILEPDGTIRYESLAVERLLGYKPEELVGKNILDYVHPEDVGLAIAELGEIREEAEFRGPIEVRFQHKNGSWRWLEGTANNLIGNPDISGVVINSRDTTERKEAEIRLREAEERYRALVENIPAVVYIDDVDEANSVLYRSPFVREVLGYEPEEFLSDPYFWQNLLHPEDRERVLAENDRTNETGEPFRIEYRMFRNDGRAVWIRDEAVLIRDEAGNPKFWQGYFVDITERKDVERRLRDAEERYRTLVEEVPAVTYTALQKPGEPSVTSYISPQIEPVLGYSPARYTGDPLFWESILHPDDRERIVTEDVRTGETGDVFREEYRMIARDGRTVWLREDSKLLGVEEDGTEVWQGIMFDITELKRTEARLRESEEQFRGAFEDASTGMALVSLEDRPFKANRALCEMLGYKEEEIVGRHSSEFTHPDDLEATNDRSGLLLTNDGPNNMSMEKRYICANGRVIWAISDVSVVRDSEGEPSHFICQFQNITERKKAEEALAQSEERFRGAFEDASTGVALVGLDNRYLRVNRALCAMLGYPEEELLSKKSFDITHPEDQMKSRNRPRRMLEDDSPKSMRIEKRYLRKDGGVVWAVSDVSLVRDSEGNPSHFVSHFQDITERKHLEEQLSYQALHDSLTGLPNRNSLQKRFERVHDPAVGRPDNPSRALLGNECYVAILFLDLDGFKGINDSFGHAAGDKLLQAVGGRLRNVVRPQDTVARLGGDEFCVLLAGVSGTAEAVQIAQRLRTSVETPFPIAPGTDQTPESSMSPADTSMASLSTSIGIAVNGPDGAGRSLDELLREADAAMYRAKKRGGALYEVVELTENTG